jgi:hypothetical protein
MELGEGEIKDDTSSGPQARTTGLDDRTTFHYRPKQTQMATLWVLAQFVHYQLQIHMDILKRERWKASHTANKLPNTDQYFEVLYSYN